MASAARAAAAWGCQASDVDTLLAHPNVDIVLILTPPATHVPLALRALDAGKHVYLEKPVAQNVAQARDLANWAAGAGLRVGCAPDTFLGGAFQAARAAIAQGRIGTPISASMIMADGGPNRRLSNPEPLFAPSAGVIRDMAPYYIMQILCLLGPCRSVKASMSWGSSTRTIETGPRADATFPVDTPTTYEGSLEMASGVFVTFRFSWDAHDAGQKAICVNGTSGRIHLPNPNWFGGAVSLEGVDGAQSVVDVMAHRYGAPNLRLSDGSLVADYRGAGLDDMAAAIKSGIPHAASLALSTHVIEIVDAIIRSAETGVKQGV